MDEQHIIIMQKNYLEFLQRTDLNRLLPLLIRQGVFPHHMAGSYQNQNKTELDRKLDLFWSLQRRGPQAFDKLVSCLREIGDSDHIFLANLLEEKKVNNNKDKLDSNEINVQDEEEIEIFNQTASSSGASPFNLPGYQKQSQIQQLSEKSPVANISLQVEPLIVKVKNAERFLDNPKESKVPLYPMRSRLRGVYLCINNVAFIDDVEDYRKGAKVDQRNLEDLFTQIGFACQSYRDQTKMDMIKIFEDFTNSSTNPNLKKADCMVIAIMSHGTDTKFEDTSWVSMADGKLVKVSWILEQFDNSNCPEFQNKPKIFLFQTCRGKMIPTPVPAYRKEQADGIASNSGVIRKMTDMLIAWATLQGYECYRDFDRGSWYIQSICEIFMTHSCDTDVEGLLKMVDEELKNFQTEDGCMQTSCYESRAFKKCYLNPGLYE